MKYFVAYTIAFLFHNLLYAQISQTRDTILMGSKFRITVVSHSKEKSNILINKAIDEIIRIENLISDWIPDTEISLINKNAGIKPTPVSKEVLLLTQRAIKYSEITNGAFDISFAAMDKIWKFDGTMDSIPSTKTIKKAIKNIGYQKIVIDTTKNTIFLPHKGMKIGFGSIGKGYAADKAREILIQNQAISGIVDASGDMATFGTQPNGKPWRIGVNNPYKKHKYADILSLTQSAVTTSGDYEKYIFINGKRYSHIINPKTGWPSTELTSVTIIGQNAEFANAFSTAIMVMGDKEGKKLLKKYPNYAGLFINNKGRISKTKNYNKVKKSILLL